LSVNGGFSVPFFSYDRAERARALGTPSRPHAISVTVKRVDQGQISNWLHDNLRVGSTLFLNGPNGTFSCIPDEAGPFLFLSGGSGITPVMAMSRWFCDTTPDTDIQFLHFAQSPDDLIFAHYAP
jgi:ferredoxin-NADP reductase